MTRPLLEARGLVKRYGSDPASVTAVAGVSLSLDAGECLAVTGASGSGKSALLGLLAGLEPPDEGEVRLDGIAFGGLSEAALAALRGRRLGIVFQSFRLLPHLSALENVRLPLDLAGTPGAEARARLALQAVGLEARAGHRPANLSGGEQQRVALARAWVPEPAVLLADEPTGNLDSATGAQIGDLLFGLARRRGTALLLVTHDPALAARADRTIHMRDGRLDEAAGPTP